MYTHQQALEAELAITCAATEQAGNRENRQDSEARAQNESTNVLLRILI